MHVRGSQRSGCIGAPCLRTGKSHLRTGAPWVMEEERGKHITPTERPKVLLSLPGAFPGRSVAAQSDSAPGLQWRLRKPPQWRSLSLHLWARPQELVQTRRTPSCWLQERQSPCQASASCLAEPHRPPQLAAGFCGQLRLCCNAEKMKVMPLMRIQIPPEALRALTKNP